MSKPLVSIYSSTYNSAKHIRDTIESVISQTYENIEYLIVDDCSTDSTPEILQEYAEQYDWIKVILLPENLHCVNASNVAYHNLKGKYFSGLAHDDVWEPDKIEKQVAFLEEHPEYALCFTHCNIINDKGEIITDRSPFGKLFNQPNRTQAEWVNKLIYGNQFCAPSVLIRTACLGDKEFYQYGLLQLQDLELWLRLVKDYPVHILQERLTRYRWFEQGQSNLSFPSVASGNRTSHENAYILHRFIMGLSDEQMISFFSHRFRNPNSQSHEEIQCEKGFLLLDMQCCHAIEYFIDLLDDNTLRAVLKDTFGYSIQDFYRDNADSIQFDNEMATMALQLKAEYEKCLEINKQLSTTATSSGKQKYAIVRAMDCAVTLEQFVSGLMTRLLYATEQGMTAIVDAKHFPIALFQQLSQQLFQQGEGNPFYAYFDGEEKDIDELYAMDSEEILYLEPLDIAYEKYAPYELNLLRSTWINEENILTLGYIYNRYLVPNERIRSMLEGENLYQKIIQKRTLGVRLAEGAEIENLEEYFACIDECMKLWECENIFVSGECAAYKSAFVKKYGEHFLLQEKTDEKMASVLKEVELLSKCDSLLGALDTISAMSILRNEAQYRYLDVYECS